MYGRLMLCLILADIICLYDCYLVFVLYLIVFFVLIVICIAAKYSVVSTLHHRAKAVCSTQQLLKDEEHLKRS